MIDSNAHQRKTNFTTPLQDQSTCVIPVQPNRNLPLRPTPITPIRQRSTSRIATNKSDIKECASVKSEIYEVVYTTQSIDANKSLSQGTTSIDTLEDRSCPSNDKDNDDNSPRGDLATSEDRIRIKDNLKRPFDHIEEESSIRSFGRKCVKREVTKKTADASEENDCAMDTADVVCITRFDADTPTEEAATTWNKINVDKKRVKVVPPLRLKKIIQKVTIDQQKHVTDKCPFPSDMETSNYKIVTETTPAPNIDSTQVIVSTTLTSNTTSLLPTNYIDNIRITIPSMPELAVQEYEITGPHFIATMTSKTGASVAPSSKMWKKPCMQNSVVWNGQKRRERSEQSPRRQLNGTGGEQSSIVADPSSKVVMMIADDTEPLENDDTNGEPSTVCVNMSTPLVSRNEEDDAGTNSLMTERTFTSDEDYRNYEKVEKVEVKSDVRIKTECEDGVGEMEGDEQKEHIYDEEEVNGRMTEDPFLLEDDKSEVLTDDCETQNSNEGKLLYRRNMLRLKLDELRAKAIDLQHKMHSSKFILTDKNSVKRFRQTINCYEKQIENLSTLLNNMSSSAHDDQETLHKLDNNVHNIDDGYNDQSGGQSLRSPSLSPPKLSPRSPLNYARAKSPSEMRNSPPVLPKICITIPDDVNLSYEQQDMLEYKAVVLEAANNCEKYRDNANKCGLNNSPFVERFLIKDTKSRQRIEIHDDECVELTLLMKPHTEVATIKNSEDTIEDCTTYDILDSLSIPDNLEKNNVVDELTDEKLETSMAPVAESETNGSQVQEEPPQEEDVQNVVTAFLIDERTAMPLSKQLDSSVLDEIVSNITSQPSEQIVSNIYDSNENSVSELVIDEAEETCGDLLTSKSTERTVPDNLEKIANVKTTKTVNVATTTKKLTKSRPRRSQKHGESASSLQQILSRSDRTTSVVCDVGDAVSRGNNAEISNLPTSDCSAGCPPLPAEGHHDAFLSIDEHCRVAMKTISGSAGCTLSYNPNLTYVPSITQTDKDFGSNYTVTTMTSSLPLVYSTSPSQIRETNFKNTQHAEAVTANERYRSSMTNSHTSKVVHQNKGNLSQQAQFQAINNDTSPNKNDLTDRNAANYRIMSQQFPVFGTWAYKQLAGRDLSKNDGKLIFDHKIAGNNQQNPLRIVESEGYKIPAPNVEQARNNYILNNLAYNQKWSVERPQERPPLLQHVQPIPLPATLQPSRQAFFPVAPVPRLYPNDYTSDPCSTTVFGYHAAYPYSATLPCPTVQSVPNVEMQLRTAKYPAMPSTNDKRLSSFSGLRNITELIRIPNTLTSSNVDRHHGLNPELLRASTYNNCDVTMDHQYSRSNYRDREANVNQYGIAKVDLTPAFALDQNLYKKPVDAILAQSGYLREQPPIGSSRGRAFRASISGQNERNYVRTVAHELSAIQSNPMSLASTILPTISTVHNFIVPPSSTSTTSVSFASSSTSSYSYSTSSKRIPPPLPPQPPSLLTLKEPATSGRTCEVPVFNSRIYGTPNLGKVIHSPNSAQKLQCFNCGANNSMFQCLGCEAAYYCNEVCQTRHWNLHVKKCPKIMPKLKKISR